MQGRFAQATTLVKNDCALQIVIDFETTEERLLAQQFLAYRNLNFDFCLHGFTATSGLPGYSSINFGFRKKNIAKVKKGHKKGARYGHER